MRENTNKYYKGETMKIDDKLKKIADYICENFEDLDMDDSVEEDISMVTKRPLELQRKYVILLTLNKCQLCSVLYFVYKYSL